MTKHLNKNSPKRNKTFFNKVYHHIVNRLDLKLIGGFGVYTSILSLNKFLLGYNYLNKLTLSNNCINSIVYNNESVLVSWYYGLILDLFKWGYVWGIVSFILGLIFLKMRGKK